MDPNTDNTQPPEFVDPSTVNIEGTQTNAPAATDSQVEAVGEATGAKTQWIDPNMVQPTGEAVVKLGGKAWIWWTVAGSMFALLVLLAGSWYFMQVRSNENNVGNGGKIDGQTDKTVAKVVCNEFKRATFTPSASGELQGKASDSKSIMASLEKECFEGWEVSLPKEVVKSFVDGDAYGYTVDNAAGKEFITFSQGSFFFEDAGINEDDFDSSAIAINKANQLEKSFVYSEPEKLKDGLYLMTVAGTENKGNINILHRDIYLTFSADSPEKYYTINITSEAIGTGINSAKLERDTNEIKDTLIKNILKK